ncbi:interleukin-6 receptor subunit beta [Sander vitreus]
MVSAGVLQLLALAFLGSALPARVEADYYLMVVPQSPVLEMETNFTATCVIINTSEVTADDLYWTLAGTTVPKERYTKINGSALNVTVPITSEKTEWLMCKCQKKNTLFFIQNEGKLIHGIDLKKGYVPGKPENLSCVAVQRRQYISSTLSCTWQPVGRQTATVPTSYTLYTAVLPSSGQPSNETQENRIQVKLGDIFPIHMILEVWVEAHNKLGKIESEHLKEDSGWFVKTDPPSDVKVFSEKSFPTSLLINWTHLIIKERMKLTYQIRYRQNGTQNWTYVPLGDTASDIKSFRLQDLQPYQVYETQVSCKNAREGHGYWSNWSTVVTKRTPEYRPTSKPDLWRIITEGDGIRQVQFICKDPVLANGRIISFGIKIQEPTDKVKNEGLEWVNVSRSSQGKITALKQIDLADQKYVGVYVNATNSVGNSPVASLFITAKARESELAPVEELKVLPDRGQLWLEWKPPSSTKLVSEYVVEWVGGGQTDWQNEKRNTTRTAIKGHLEKFVCYNVSVYPIYHGWIGKPASEKAYLEQGAPLEAPVVRLDKPGRNQATLGWTEIPQGRRQGFITNYTIFYTSGSEVHNITVPANTNSYTLKSLSGNTKYDTWIKASTIEGSISSFNHSFTTLKYAPGEMECIVVGVSLGFLFIVVMIMLLCVYKKDVIKENFWPQIPDPGESTIGNWLPDYPLKAETQDSGLSGISVLDVDVCDGKCVFEEDKASLPLKKDKYLSEEHSSGIGGSSCMSSPRQSVSDSDEGGDMADTTASTVQYSSVVPASSGYKGQTPNSQPQQALFSRSESTQPLLDSEENPDMLLQEASRQSLPRRPRFTDGGDPAGIAEQQELLEPLDFCPLGEDSEQATPVDGQAADWLPAAVPPLSSYMPQLGGYRPQ